MNKRFCKHCNQDKLVKQFRKSTNKCDACEDGKYNNAFLIPKTTSEVVYLPNQSLTQKRRAREKQLDNLQIEDDFSL